MGWTVTVKQQENYNRKAVAYLDELQIEGVKDPLLEVIHEQSGETVYMLRIKGTRYRPKVFSEGKYTIKLTESESGRENLIKGMTALPKNKGVRRVGQL